MASKQKDHFKQSCECLERESYGNQKCNGRLFQTVAPAAANIWSPNFALVHDVRRSQCWRLTLLVIMQSLAKYSDASPWKRLREEHGYLGLGSLADWQPVQLAEDQLNVITSGCIHSWWCGQRHFGWTVDNASGQPRPRTADGCSSRADRWQMHGRVCVWSTRSTTGKLQGCVLGGSSLG